MPQFQEFVARFGAQAFGSQIVGEIGHITASAWMVAPDNSHVLLVFGRKENAWKLPGAHCDGNFDGKAFQTAQREATRALGGAPATQNALLWALGEREIAAYWNTPAHRHFELIFLFLETPTQDLPRGARWFSLDEAAQLGDATIARLVQKNRCQL